MAHIHKYYKVRVGRGDHIIYRCSVPRCRHSLTPEYMIGRETICWSCNAAFVITRKTFNTAPSAMTSKPVCEVCTEKRRKKNKNDNAVIGQMLEAIGVKANESDD